MSPAQAVSKCALSFLVLTLIYAAYQHGYHLLQFLTHLSRLVQMWLVREDTNSLKWGVGPSGDKMGDTTGIPGFTPKLCGAKFLRLSHVPHLWTTEGRKEGSLDYTHLQPGATFTWWDRKHDGYFRGKPHTSSLSSEPLK